MTISSGTPSGTRGTRLIVSRTRSPSHLSVRRSSPNTFTVQETGSELFVHAGVVGWRGRAILLPGPSMSGKSSLVAALLRAGAEYYSDEYAIIGTGGLVHPYAKPLGLRGPGKDSRPFTPEALGGRVGTRPLPVSLILSTSYSPGAQFGHERGGEATD